MNFTSYTRHPEAWHSNTILLLDPDEVIQMLYRDELGGEGYEVIPVDETDQVMRYIETYQPILLVMEAGLYGRNGLRVLHDIRSAYPELPVIVCTADPSFKTEPMTLIADDVVLKGMSVSGLKQSVQNVLAFRNLIKRTADYSTGEGYGGRSYSTRPSVCSDILGHSRSKPPPTLAADGTAQTKKEKH